MNNVLKGEQDETENLLEMFSLSLAFSVLCVRPQLKTIFIHLYVTQLLSQKKGSKEFLYRL